MLRMLPRVLNVSRKLIVRFAFAVLFASAALPAAAQEWAIDQSLSKISFEVPVGAATLTGEFRQFQAEIHFDPDALDAAEISATIDMNNVATSQPQADATLLGKDWFDTQTYPAAGFRSVSVKKGRSEGQYVIEGNLTIKDTTRPVTLPFLLAVKEGEATIKAEMEVKRSDFGVGPSTAGGPVTVGDVVKLRLDLAAKRLDN